MSEMKNTLPQGWEWKKLGAVVDFQGGSQPPKKEFIFEFKNGYIRFLQIRDFSSDNNLTYIPIANKNRLCNENDILIGRYGASVGKILTGKSGAYNVALLKTIPNKNLILASYLFYYLKSDLFQYPLLTKTAKRAAQDGFSKDDIYDYLLPLPPLEEQRRIVKVLDGLFAKIDKSIALLDVNITSANALMPSALNEVFEELGEKWEKTTLANIAKFISGYAFKSDNFESSNQLKVIKITNVGVQEFIEDDEEKLPSHFIDKYSNFMAESNDIAIALTRPYISNGLKVSIVSDSFHGAMVNQRVATLRAFEDKANQRFIYYFLCTNNVLDLVKELSKTLNQPNLSINDLKKFEIPLPPIDIQTQTVAYLDALHVKVEVLKKAQATKKAKLLALKASLLESAFKGEL